MKSGLPVTRKEGRDIDLQEQEKEYGDSYRNHKNNALKVLQHNQSV